MCHDDIANDDEKDGEDNEHKQYQNDHKGDEDQKTTKQAEKQLTPPM